MSNAWEARPFLPCLYLVLDIVQQGPDTNESPHDFNDRIASAYRHYLITKMSWAGFKKNVNRATTQVMMKTGT